jgi:EAL domain-containing protein (putative c-di-GMP-specific phosphodiesterase class I)
MMLQDIIGLIRNRGPKILVEGVETEQHLQLLQELKIDFVQGYHVGRPAPLDSFRNTTAGSKAILPPARRAPGRR